MKQLFLEMVICIFVSVFLMIYHEMVKVVVYIVCKGKKHHFHSSPWKVWRYIDPLGILLGMICYVPVSKPYFFRIRDKKTNLCLGICGILSLAFLAALSIGVLRIRYGGMAGLDGMVFYHWWEQLLPLFLECLATLSLGMLLANLFPVSTFDMGNILSGISAKLYLNIVKSDGIIKLLFMLSLLLNLIHYLVVNFLWMIL
jgi:hypothetical protein